MQVLSEITDRLGGGRARLLEWLWSHSCPYCCEGAKNLVQLLPPAGYSNSWGRTRVCSNFTLLPHHWHSLLSWWLKPVGGCVQKPESEQGKCELQLYTLNNLSQGFSSRALWPLQSALVHVNELSSSCVLCLPLSWDDIA